jgi:hypothetical protein
VNQHHPGRSQIERVETLIQHGGNPHPHRNPSFPLHLLCNTTTTTTLCFSSSHSQTLPIIPPQSFYTIPVPLFFFYFLLIFIFF